ncbi:hypothetical protein BDQ17DRAFT_1333241 [Cyathus striatus]|nr:hypothetical protein BDQ17DRAFT_1333241 [Cyathus striatus]
MSFNAAYTAQDAAACETYAERFAAFLAGDVDYPGPASHGYFNSFLRRNRFAPDPRNYRDLIIRYQQSGDSANNTPYAPPPPAAYPPATIAPTASPFPGLDPGVIMAPSSFDAFLHFLTQCNTYKPRGNFEGGRGGCDMDNSGGAQCNNRENLRDRIGSPDGNRDRPYNPHRGKKSNYRGSRGGNNKDTSNSTQGSSSGAQSSSSGGKGSSSNVQNSSETSRTEQEQRDAEMDEYLGHSNGQSDDQNGNGKGKGKDTWGTGDGHM